MLTRALLQCRGCYCGEKQHRFSYLDLAQCQTTLATIKKTYRNDEFLIRIKAGAAGAKHSVARQEPTKLNNVERMFDF